MTTIGELDRRITLQYPTKTRSASGAEVITWNDAATVWAKKTTHRSNEAVQAMAETGTAIHNFRIRYRADVRASWRIKEGNSYMAIIGPPMEVRQGIGGRFLDITAREAKS